MHGGIVVVKPASDYIVGDVITFGEATKTRAPTTHRIVEIKQIDSHSVYITKGDANNAPDDGEVRKGEIIGKVLFDVPYVGYAVDLARKPYGFLILVIIPAVIIISDQLKNIYFEIKKMRAAKKAAD